MNTSSRTLAATLTALCVAGTVASAQTLYAPGGTVGSSLNSHVGIGISSPGVRLHVYSDVTSQSEVVRIESRNFSGLEIIGDRSNLSTEPGGAYVQLSQDGGAVRALFAVVQSAGHDGMGGSLSGSTINSMVLANRWLDATAHIHLATQNAVRMTVTGSGNVGIGTSTPQEKLQVAGAVVANGKVYGGGYYGTGAGSINGFGLEVGGSSPNATSGSSTIYFHHWGAIAHQLRYTSGTLYWEAAGNGYGTSDTPGLVIGGGMNVAVNGGNVGIGTTNPTQKLSVNGSVRAKEVIVEASPWADDVFAPGYALPTVDEVAAHIATAGHLPGVPSAATVAEQGVALGEMQTTLLRKVEELTLYVIAQDKRIKSLEQQLAAASSSGGAASVSP